VRKFIIIPGIFLFVVLSGMLLFNAQAQEARGWLSEDFEIPEDPMTPQANAPGDEEQGVAQTQAKGPSETLEIIAQDTRTLPLTAEEAQNNLNQIISVNFKDMDLKQALSTLAETYNLNILAGEDVKGAITINFTDVPLKDVLSQMLKLKNFTYIFEGNIIKVINAEEAIETRALSINHIDLTLAAEVITPKLTEKGAIKMNTATNQLIVTDVITKLDNIGKIIEEIDVPPAQVHIESKLIDITHTDLNNLGVTWEGESLGVKVPFGPKPRPKLDSLDYTNAGTSSTLSGSQLVLGFVRQEAQVTATIDALIKHQKARVIANPSITTLNNIEARITIGEKYPIREQTQTTTGTLETTRFVDVGTTLKVTPKINNDGTIQLTIHPEVSSVSSTLDAGPRITTREADTTVIVKDGDTVVIAGLLLVEDDMNKSRIPFLGDIPVFGLLFRSQDKDKQQKELVIFMTPRILNRASNKSYAEALKIPSETDLVAQRLSATELFTKAEDLEKGESLQTKVFPVELRLNEAAKNYERIFILYPDNYFAEIGLYRAGLIYERLKDYPAALSVYQKLVEVRPDGSYEKYCRKRIKKLFERVNKTQKAN